MKKKSFIICLTILVLVLFTFVFASCTQENEDPKTAPVYKGMEIVDKSATLASSASVCADSNLSGDLIGKDTNINLENPFNQEVIDGKLPIDSTIDNKITFNPPSQKIYYAQQNQDIYVVVHFENPDNYEILSFTLNGTKYTDYMFEQGSNLENIILKYNVGENIGVLDLTIDKIKYVDGENIKDVKIDGNQTVKAGVFASNQLNISQTNINIGFDSYSFDIEFSEEINIIESGEGQLKTILYDGKDIVQEKPLIFGKNHVVFDNLKSNKLYQCLVIGYYDNLSGNGFKKNILKDIPFYTKAPALFTNVVVGKNTVSFDYSVDESVSDFVVNKLVLVNGDNSTDINPSLKTINNIMSNSKYTLLAEFNCSIGKGSIKFDFNTKNMTIPTISLTIGNVGKRSIFFNVNEVDGDSIGEITKVEAIDNLNNSIVLTDLSKREISNLNSNTEYILKVTYEYDLNDGSGKQNIVLTSKKVKTLKESQPSIDIVGVKAGTTSVEFDVVEVDEDNVGEISSLAIQLDGDFPVESEDLTIREFKNLYANSKYTIILKYTVTFNDGQDPIELIKKKIFRTQSLIEPTLKLSNVVATKDSVSFETTENDPDNIGDISKIELLYKIGEENKIMVVEDTSLREIKPILSNTSYTLVVTYTYDLHDGQEVVNIKVSDAFITEAKSEPQMAIANYDSTINSILVLFQIEDPDNTIKTITSELYDGSVLVDTQVAKNSECTFINLIEAKPYTIKYKYTYDLNDGSALKEVKSGQYDEFNIYTSHTIGLVNASIPENSRINYGENLKIDFTITNPKDAKVNALIVNGRKREILKKGSTTSFTAVVNNKGEFDGGQTDLIISGIVSCIEGDTSERTTIFENPIHVNCYFYGPVNVVDFYFVNELYNNADYIKTNKMYGNLIIDNKCNYKINSITFKNSENHWTEAQSVTTKLISNPNITNGYYFDITPFTGENNVTLVSINYSLDDYTNELILNRTYVYNLTVVVSNQNITTVDEFKNMKSNATYTLMNDLDFSNVNDWIPYDFGGILDGNGKKISNLHLTFDNSYVESKKTVTMFKSNSGIIKNLTLDNCSINVETTDRSNYYGGLSLLCQVNNGLIQNCNILNSAISEICSYERPGEENVCVGGICGLNMGTIDGCINKADIDVTCYNLGGICGHNTNKILNCKNYGTIVSDKEVSKHNNDAIGGICGSSYTKSYESAFQGSPYTFTTISNCINYGRVSGTFGYAGIVGFDAGIITKCINYGSLKSPNVDYDRLSCIAGIAAYSDGLLIEDCINYADIYGLQFMGGINAMKGLGADLPTQLKINRCINYGNVISGSNSSFCCGIGASEYICVSNCINYGEISACEKNSGIVDEASVIINCINLGKITTNKQSYVPDSMRQKGGAISSESSLPNVRNCYTLYVFDESVDVTCTIQQLNTKDFYIKVLGWDEEYWDFTTLDISNKVGPKLKNVTE